MTNEIQFPAELYSEALDMYKTQVELYWRRLRVFLLLNGALFSIVVFELSRREFLSVISLFGILFSLLWMIVLKRAQEKVHRWGEVVVQIETLYQTVGLPFLFTTYAKETEPPRYEHWLFTLIFGSIPGVESRSVQFVPFLIGIFWMVILVYLITTPVA